MFQGYLRVILRLADGAVPIPDESVYIKTDGISVNSDKSLNRDTPVSEDSFDYRVLTDSSGATEPIAIPAPDPAISLNEYDSALPYSLADVYVDVQGYFPVRILSNQIYAGQIATLPINLTPVTSGYIGATFGVIEYEIPPNTLITGIERTQEFAPSVTATPQIARAVAIPERITVHLGVPSSDAENVSVSFPDYVKNVASSEIYPTWNEEAVTANVIAIVSLTLNRIYTEWYRSQGYAFDITNSTRFDQSFVNGRNIFDSISRVVDEYFDTYITKDEYINPLFASYCDGRRVSCDGMSQWGSEALANRGYTALAILKSYYGDDITLENVTEIADTTSYPGYPLSLGSDGRDVVEIRRQLYRISDNYPLIPKVNPILGVFDSALDSAVRVFQEIFGLSVDGIVGKATWYKISYVYASITKLAELTSSGETQGLPTVPPTETLRPGDDGRAVARLQFLLAYISLFYPSISTPSLDGIYGDGTEQAVLDFQTTFGLEQTGIVTAGDWAKLYEVYNSILRTVTPSLGEQSYPGSPLEIGSRGDNVLLMQSYLNRISDSYPVIPKIDADGIYGNATDSAVRAFQRRFFLEQTGIIDAVTWEQIVEIYNFVTRS